MQFPLIIQKEEMKSAAISLFVITLLFSIKTEAQLSSKVEIKNTGNVSYHQWFSDKTMRVDYFHTGNAKEETFAIDKVQNDGNWPGSQKILIDKLELGPYFFKIIDEETKTLLYSRGFASIFGEWQTTLEAEIQWGTFHESLRFPWPLKTVRLFIMKRDENNNFQAVWENLIDPTYRQVISEERKHNEKTDIIVENGPAANKLDIVILGDGYTAKEMKKFRSDAQRLSSALLNTEPFASQQMNINIRAVETPALQSGVTKPHHSVYKSSPLSVQYSAFDSERYALTYDNKTVRNVASAVPYDCMVIIMNERTYGGGGIYNLYTTVAADNSFSEYIMVHEFGHHLAALADEYYTSSVAYEVPTEIKEPWETNITALLDPEHLKWKEMVDLNTPIPTPWNKEEFDIFGFQNQQKRDSLRSIHSSEEIMEVFFNHQLKVENDIFSREKYAGEVGAFEGGGYTAKGIYRPQVDCIMFTRHMQFCKVCQKSIVKVIRQYTE